MNTSQTTVAVQRYLDDLGGLPTDGASEAVVRDPTRLKHIPAEEQAAWTDLWRQVDTVTTPGRSP